MTDLPIFEEVWITGVREGWLTGEGAEIQTDWEGWGYLHDFGIAHTHPEGATREVTQTLPYVGTAHRTRLLGLTDS